MVPSVRFELTHTGLEVLLLYPNSKGNELERGRRVELLS